MKPIDLIRIALAIEILAYYDKNYLDRTLANSNARLSETVQNLLRNAEVLLMDNFKEVLNDKPRMDEHFI